MNENEFQNYQLLEQASILSLNGIWNFLQEKIRGKISKLDGTAELDLDQINSLKATLSTFDNQIKKINSREGEPHKRSAKPQTTTSKGVTKSAVTEEEVFEDYLEYYFKWESEKIDEIVTKLPEIFGDVFDSFIGDIEFYAQNMEILHRQPNLIKFLVFNLTERFPPKKYEDNTCDFD